MANNPNYHFLEVPQNIVGYITDKPRSSKSYFKYLLSRTQMMFKYTNLPETIDPILLERMLQVNGVACITEAPNDFDSPALYAFSGSFGGELDIYYRPTKFVVANPHLGKEGFSKEVIVNGTEKHTGVIMYNDSEWQGLTPLICRYAALMTENVLTVRVADIMLRKMDIIIAGTDKAKKSSEVFLKKLENGELAALADSAFMESIRTLPVSNYNGSYLIQFIELQQYLKGSFYNELGLRANYNMKREAIGEGESTLDADSVLPLCENMLFSRRKCVAEINELFGTEISVDYNSAWLENHIDSYLSIYNKIAESVANMHNEERAAEFGGQPTGGMFNGENSQPVQEIGWGNIDGTDIQSSNSGNTEQSINETDNGTGENAELRNISEDRRDEGAPGEERHDSDSGVGRELEGTGQDEELIELEEVVEKMIDNVYDDVVGQPTSSDSNLGGGELELSGESSMKSDGEKESGESGESSNQPGESDSEESEKSEESEVSKK